jgi:hypothetical protein
MTKLKRVARYERHAKKDEKSVEQVRRA